MRGATLADASCRVGCSHAPSTNQLPTLQCPVDKAALVARLALGPADPAAGLVRVMSTAGGAAGQFALHWGSTAAACHAFLSVLFSVCHPCL